MQDSFRIRQLPHTLANQIAAGEVIERPASVLKECIENSLDAGATQIDIEIENAGMGLIRVTDNGHGIHKEDLKLALSRHATSKIQQVEDLFCISSLGFRGEALASMASVSKVRLLSRTKAAVQGWEVRSDAELVSDVLPCAHNMGTTVELRDLFYNVPVRRKFLRSEKTELYHIIELFKKFVLSHFSFAFSLKSNQRRLYVFAKADNESQKLTRIKKVCGLNFIDQAFTIDTQYESMRLWGWIGCSALAKRQADTQYFFINRRMVRDKLITHAVKNAYQTLEDALIGLYPSYLLHFELPSDRLDVNVHPTKHEVRFVEASLVHDFIEKCIKEALNLTRAASNPPHASKFPVLSAPVQSRSVETSYPSYTLNTIPKLDYSPSVSSVNLNNTAQTIQPMNKHTRDKWYVIESEGKIYLVDLFCAKQTIFFHFMNTSICQQMRKALLFPMTLPMGRQQNIIPLLTDLGFIVNQSEERLKITHLPYFMTKEAVISGINKISELETLTLTNIKNILLSQIDDASLCLIPREWMYNFFKQWISQTSRGPWVRFDSTEINCQIQENTVVVDD